MFDVKVSRDDRLPLCDEGLLGFPREREVTVAGSAERGAVVARARELMELARNNGCGRAELIEIITDIG